MKKEKQNKFYHGIPCTFTIPNKIVNRYTTGERVIATSIFGVPGFIATCGSERKNIQINGTIKLTNHDIIISSNSTNDIHIPYSQIMRCEKTNILGTGIHLFTGEKIEIQPIDIDIFDFIEKNMNK